MLDVLSQLLDDLALYAGLHSLHFILYSLLCLAPFFIASLYFSRQLSCDIDAKLSQRKTRLKHHLETCQMNGEDSHGTIYNNIDQDQLDDSKLNSMS